MKISKEEWSSRTGEYPFRKDRKPNNYNKKNVDHPPHYNEGRLEAIEVIEDWKLGFHCGNVVKYIARHTRKGTPKEDIEKAIWYLQRYLEAM